ncbi:MAG: glycoside hydrolase family 3 C-terminal domain-containing protein, partial [Victivallales bacterium]|nr:glycoside hydrolase family 3 C-terminal domain-containing protein [Victivallales bacterium]
MKVFQAMKKHTAKSLEQQIEKLLAKLTLDEKLCLIRGRTDFNTGDVPRLGIEGIRTSDGPQGVRLEDGRTTTALPCGQALSCTFSPKSAEKAGRLLGRECRALGVQALLGPGMNLMRTPLNGRSFEYFGEDPRLCGETAAAWIAGLQSVKVAPCLKHYCFNDQEADRTIIDVECPDRAAREIYIRPFEIAVQKADPWAFMNSYNKYRGQWTSHSAYLNDILCKEYGATGAMIPDWGGVHGMPEAINGGTSIQSSTKVDPARDKRELKLLAEGKIDRARFDDSVRRALRLYFRVGAFDADDPKERALQKRCEESFRSQEHQDLARRAAEEGFVMVKNDGLLPFRGKTVAVVGPLVEVKHAMSDKDTDLRWHGGSGAVKAAREITPLEGFRRVFGEENVITGANAAEVAAKADIVV